MKLTLYTTLLIYDILIIDKEVLRIYMDK